MYVLIVVLPLLSSIIMFLYSRYLGKNVSVFLMTLVMGLILGISLFVGFEVMICGMNIEIKLCDWIESGMFSCDWGLYFDELTVGMLLIITFISYIVHLYSLDYMSEDPYLLKFISYLSLFTFFMIVLVTANNFIQMFLGWEGVGVVSYLLISFWTGRREAGDGAIKAIIINKFGDFSLVLAIIVIYYEFKTVQYNEVFVIIDLYRYVVFEFFNISILNLIVIFLIIAAIGKSAQLGLHTWLPEAMEGPTPVSALLHAATMVTAGVFILLRCEPIISASLNGSIYLIYIGVITTFIGGFIGANQIDVKKIVAYSTCSQLGIMIYGCGIGSNEISFLHLLNHACFKALLFLSVGSLIHSLSGTQDIRLMGGLGKVLPSTYYFILLGSLNLVGGPGLSAFTSKEAFFEIMMVVNEEIGVILYVTLFSSAVSSLYYSCVFVIDIFIESPKMSVVRLSKVSQMTMYMYWILLLLFIGSVVSGDLFDDFYSNIQIYNIVLEGNIEINSAEFLEFVEYDLPWLMFHCFIIWGIYIFIFDDFDVLVFNTSVKEQLNFDTTFGIYALKVMFLGKLLYNIIDRGLLEIFGPTGLVRLSVNILKSFKNLQTGIVFNNIYIMIIGIVIDYWVNGNIYSNEEFVIILERGFWAYNFDMWNIIKSVYGLLIIVVLYFIIKKVYYKYIEKHISMEIKENNLIK